jgi:integrase
MSPDEARRLLAVARSLKVRVVLALGYGCGLRASEVVRLTVGDIDRDLGMHPTVKPVALVVDAMRDCSRRKSIVLDAFAGSGTTIVAAEQIGRRAFCLELDPAYDQSS